MSRMLSSRFGRMAGFVVPVAVVGAIATGVVPAYADDITPPSLVGLSIVGQNGSTPYSADVTSDDSSVAVLVHVTDDTGIYSVDVTVRCVTDCSDTGQIQAVGGTSFGSVLTGPPGDRSGSISVTLPQGSASGTWQVTDVVVLDDSSNSHDYDDSALVPYDATRAFTVSKTADTTAPALADLSLPGSTIDVTTEDKQVALSAHIVDTVPGFDHGTITLGDGLGNTRDFAFSRDGLHSGTFSDGTFLSEAQSFGIFDTGDWTVTAVDLFDSYGNENTTDSSPLTLHVTKLDDSAGPTVTGTPSWSTGSVDTTDGPAQTNLTIHLSDDVSGFNGGFLELDDGSGDLIDGYIDPSMRTTGDTYVVPFDVYARTIAGSYSFSSISLLDRYGNSNDPIDMSSWPALDVTTGDDSTDGPAMSGFAVGPSPLNLGDNSFRGLTLNVDITDDVSGFDHADLHLTDAGDNPVDDSFALSESDRVSGTRQDGHYRTTLFPQYLSDAYDGTWHVTSIDLVDLAGNTTNVTAGFPVTFSVTEQPSGDSAAPQLTSISVTPTSVDTTTGDATVHVHAVATDAGGSGQASGLQFAGVSVVSPSTNEFANDGFFGPDQLSSGDDTDGTYDFDMTIPKYSETGDWTLTDVYLMDNAGNVNDVSGSQLFAIAGTQTVTVSGPLDIHPPALVSVTATPTDVDTETAPTVTFDVHATDNQATNDGSGVNGGYVVLTSPTGATQEADFSSGDLTSGNEGDGHYAASLTLPKFAETAGWTVTVGLYDNVGMAAEYSSADIAALANGSTSTVNVTGAPDTHAPVVTGVVFTPAPVDSSTGAKPLVVDVHITDDQATSDGAGVAEADIALSSPHGSQPDFSTDLTLVSGSPTDGWWEGGFTVPKFVDSGTWPIESIGAVDANDNGVVYDQAALTTAGLTKSVDINGIVDSAAPTIAGITLPASVDVTSADQVVNVGVHVQDSDGTNGPTSGSGVAEAGGSVLLMGPNGATESEDFPTSPSSGSSVDGTWTVPVTIHRFTDSGTWHVEQITLNDVYGNSAEFTGAQLSGFTHTFDVASTPDTTAPTLTSLAFAPTSVDVTHGSANVTVTVGATDSASGFGGGYIELTSPGGTQTAFGSISGSPVSGVAQSGTFTGIVSIPQYAEQGAWTVTDLFLYDNVENFVDYPSDVAFPGGVTTTLDVVDTDADVSAPAVVGISITPAPVDVSSGQKQVTFDVHLTDDKSGVTGGGFTLMSPSGVESGHDFGALTGGTPSDGHWLVNVPFGVHAENGTWTITGVDAVDAAGNSLELTSSIPATNSFTVTGATPVAPGAPTDVWAGPGNGSVDLSWSAPADNGGAPITGYDVQVTPARSGHSSPDIAHFDTATTEQVVTGLTNGTAYTFQVRAVNSAGNGLFSAASAAVTPQPVEPGAPTAVSGTAGNGQVALTWTAPVDDGGSPITGYHVQYSSNDGLTWSEGPSGALTSTTTGATVTGLTNGTSYIFQVAAINAVGTGDYSSPSAALSPHATNTAPGAPTAVGGTRGNAQVTLTWTAPVDNGGAAITGYHVQYSSNGGSTWSEGPSSALTSTATGATVTGLTNGTSYVFRVAAKNSVGEGAFSATSTAVTPATAPGAPTGVAGTGGDGQVQLSWTGPSTNGGSPVTGYHVQYSSDGGTTWSEGPSGALTSTTTDATVTGLTNGTAYVFRVAAINAVNEGAFSSASSTVTPHAGATAPNAPTAVAGAAGPGQVSLTWTAPADDGGSALTGYHVQYSSDGGTTWLDGPASALTSTATGVVVTGLANGTAYVFQVAAINAAGTGVYSAPSAAVTPHLDSTALTRGKSTTIAYGKSIKLSTTLTDTTTHTAIAGGAVRLMTRPGTTGTFKLLKATTTGSGGVASYTFSPKKNAQYRWEYAASGPHAAATSTAQTVSVSQVVSVTRTAKSVVHGHVVKFYGTVKPAIVGQYVYLQQKSGTKWKTLAVKAKIFKQKLPNGKTVVGYVITRKPTAKGTFTYRIYKPKTSSNAAGYSAAFTLKVT